MDHLLDDLEAAARACEEVAAVFESGPLHELCKGLHTAATDVGESASGSWWGYQATVYYRGFKEPPRGEEFNPRLGSYGGFGTSASRDWVECSPQEVVDEILRRAGNPDTKPIKEAAAKAADTFRRSKNEILATLDAMLSHGDDSRLKETRVQVQKLEDHFRREGFCEALKPTGKFVIQDPRVMSNPRVVVPPHIAFSADIMADTSYGEQNRRLAELARQTLQYLAKRSKLQTGGNKMGLKKKLLKRALQDPNLQRTVFLVFGRDSKRVRAIKEFLSRIDVLVLEWEEAREKTGKPTPYVGEIVDAGMRASQATLVLFTGDDVAKLRDDLLKESDGPHERDLTPQPRPNVIYEAGMAMGRDPNRVILTQVGELRGFSDIHGLHIPRLNNSVGSREALIGRMEAAGVRIKKREGWETAGDLT